MKTPDKPKPRRDKGRREAASGYTPKTLLGKRLWALRQNYIAEGGKLLNWDELEKEIALRKGLAE